MGLTTLYVGNVYGYMYSVGIAISNRNITGIGIQIVEKLRFIQILPPSVIVEILN